MFIKYNRFLPILAVIPVFITGVLFSNTAAAADPDYDIEIVIFEDVSGRYAKSENWPLIPEEDIPDNTKQPAYKPAHTEKRIRYLQKDSLKLSDEIKKIEEGREYKVMLHTAWRQPGLDTTSAFPVHITSSNDGGEAGSYVEGDIKLVMSRYLHVSGNLTFYKEQDGGYVPYPVTFNRRMKSREMHYIDHPMVGILVIVTPVSR